MRSRLDDLLDVLIVLLAAALHLGAARRLESLPPSTGFESVLVLLPVVAMAAAVVLLLVRRDRRGLAVACLVQWLLVVYTLPASFLGLNFVPAAAALTVALLRSRRAVSSGWSDAG